MTSANTNDAGNCGEVLVSVIMPIYNAAVYLEEALGSVCQQSYRPIEVAAVITLGKWPIDIRIILQFMVFSMFW